MLKKRGRKEKSEQKQNSRVNRRWLWVPIAAIACMILAGVSFNVYSKYYKTGYNPGVAVASGFYFASDYASGLEKEDQARITTVADLKSMVERLHIRMSDSPWSTVSEGNASSSTVEVHISNFANQLLYNDKNLDVSYTVEFLLMAEDSPEGVTYRIKQGTGFVGDTEQLMEPGKSIQFSGTLKGGRPISDLYQIKVDIANLNKYYPARILMLAYPTAPSYVKEDSMIAGIIMADYNSSELKITEQKFTIEDELNKADTAWKAELSGYSGLEYQVRTTGSYVGDGVTGSKQRMELRWDPKMYKLDEENKYRQQYEGTEYFNEAEGRLSVEILPYASLRFRFYYVQDGPGVGFWNIVNESSYSLSNFKDSIHAEITAITE